ARFVGADLADATSIARFAKEVGDIDILVNNAGFSVWGPTETFEITSFDAMFAANVRAPFFLVSAFAPGMVTRGTGSIINISSMAGRLGQGRRHVGAGTFGSRHVLPIQGRLREIRGYLAFYPERAGSDHDARRRLERPQGG